MSARRFAYPLRLWLDLGRYLLPRPTPRRRWVPERHLVFLVRGMPPAFHGGVFRVSATAAAIAGAGWRVTAIDTDAPPEVPQAGRELEARIPATIDIRRWPAHSGVQPEGRFIPNVDGGFASIRPIVDAATPALREHSGAVILATGPFFAEFIAAYHLHNVFGAPYILDYRDEWTEGPLDFVRRGRMDRMWERRCLARASAIVFATETMRRHYLETFPVIDPTRTITIRNGWDDVPNAPAFPLDTRDDGVVSLGFFGSLGAYDFDEFAATLGATLTIDPSLSSILTVNLFGRIEPSQSAAIQNRGLASTIRFHGVLTHPESRSTMRQCTALLALNSPRLHRVATAKLYEYVASRRPILLYGEGGEQQEILRPIPGVVVVARGDVNGLAAALRYIRSGEPIQEIRANHTDYAESMSRSNRSREWVRVLEGLATGGLPSGAGRSR